MLKIVTKFSSSIFFIEDNVQNYLHVIFTLLHFYYLFLTINIFMI